MQVAVGTSTKSDIKAAVDEAALRIKQANLIIMLSSYGQLEEGAKLVKEKFPDVPLMGTSATTYYSKDSSDSRLILIAFGQDAIAQVGLVSQLSTAPMVDIPALEDKLKKIVPGKEDTVCIEFCTGNEERLVTSLNVALEKAGVSLAGGTIFGIPEGAESLAMVDGQVYKDACCYAIIKNTSGKARVYSELIFKPMEGAKPHIATSVNLAAKELITLDGRPAADVYCQDAGVTKSQIGTSVLTNPLGRIIGDEIFIASCYDVGKNNSLINYKKINTNDTISVMELVDYEAKGADTRRKMTSDAKKISFVFSVNCIYRHLLFDGRGYLPAFLSSMASLGTHVGIVGGGEQCNKQHVNQTMVAVVFE